VSQTPARRILVITYHFPPDGEVGGLRWHGLSRYLGRLGWEVHVVTASPGAVSAPADRVHVHVVRPARTLGHRYVAMKRWLLAATDESPATDPTPVSVELREEERRGLLGPLRRALSYLLGFPDYGRGWIVRAALRARRLLRRNDFDAVISSGPPHAAHVSGALATWGRREPHWVDLRDPWSSRDDGLQPEIALRRNAPDPFHRLLERWVFGHARHALTVTAPFAEQLGEAYPALAVDQISNGVDPERLPVSTPPRFEGLALAYVGTLYLKRDLGTVLRGMRAFASGCPEARAGLRLRFAGSMDESQAESLEHQIEATGMGEAVEVLGIVPADRALDLLRRSHLALVLAQGQPLQIPAKLYECVALGIPTLVVSEPDSATSQEATRLGALTCAPDDAEGVRAVLDDCWHGRLQSATSIEAATYPVLALRFARLFERSVGPSAPVG